MELHIDAIKRDVAGVVAALGDEDVVEQWRRLADAVEPSLRLRLIDLLSEAALSLNSSSTSVTSRCAWPGGSRARLRRRASGARGAAGARRRPERPHHAAPPRGAQGEPRGRGGP